MGRSVSPWLKGVGYDKRWGKWTAQCKGKKLGCYATEDAAVQVGPGGISICLFFCQESLC